MKKLHLLLFFILIINFCFSQNDTISENIYQNNGRLGIGINNAGYLLDIRDDAGEFGANPRQFIYLHNINNSIHSNVAINFKSGTEENVASEY
ncbi:MAG: hypothetical protein GXO79_07430 [Chlorobi bacterium]|nr:hypothetical protein [Chlorobiota bacterium]